MLRCRSVGAPLNLPGSELSVRVCVSSPPRQCRRDQWDMGLCVAAQAPLEEPRRLRQWSGTAGGWLRITLVSFLATLPVEQLRAFPSSLSDCQTPTGWNCSGESLGRVVAGCCSVAQCYRRGSKFSRAPHCVTVMCCPAAVSGGFHCVGCRYTASPRGERMQSFFFFFFFFGGGSVSLPQSMTASHSPPITSE